MRILVRTKRTSSHAAPPIAAFERARMSATRGSGARRPGRSSNNRQDGGEDVAHGADPPNRVELFTSSS